jgi:hypothetical protein
MFVYNDVYGVLAIAALTVVFFVSLFAEKEERANWVYVGRGHNRGQPKQRGRDREATRLA